MTLPKELIQQIEEESKAYGRESVWYVEGAAKYALQLHTLQQDYERLRKALEGIVRVEDSRWTTQPDVKSRIWDIANTALTAQPEADNQQTENV